MDRPITRPWWKKPTAIWPISVVALIALCSMSLGLFGAERTLRVVSERTRVATAEESVFHDFIPLNGQVVARDIVYVTALEGGGVFKLLVQPGDPVTEGQALVELRNPDLQKEVMTSELSIMEQINGLRNTEMTLEDTRLTSEQQLAEAKYNMARLKRQAERQKYYFSKGITSAEERDKAVDELNHYQELSVITDERNKKQEALRVRRIPELRKSLTQLQRNLADTREKLDNLTVRAPASGRVSLIELNVGQNCTRGEHIGDVILDTGFKLVAEVNQYYLSRVLKNQKADVDIDGKRIMLTVTRVYPQVKDGTFKVELNFDGEMPTGLLAGQQLTGKLHLGNDRPGLILPTGSFLEATGGKWIFVLEPDGKSALRRSITIGRQNMEQIEISKGLRPGEKAIISDYSGFEKIDRIVLTGSKA